MTKRALILGVGGMDGSHLAEILLEKNYEVHGLYRRSSVDNLWRIKHIRDRITLHRGDLLEEESIYTAIWNINPTEIYNFADQDDAGWSEVIPHYSRQVTYQGAKNLLEMLPKDTKLFIPLSVLMFDGAPPPQNLQSPPNPKSPYALAKYYLWQACEKAREVGVDVRCAIYFNHDSPGRSTDYVLQRICKEAVEVARGQRDKIVLKNAEQRIDIGYARDYAEAAWRIMQLPEPLDLCVGTGTAWTLKDMAYEALEAATLDSLIPDIVQSLGETCPVERRADTAPIWDVLGWRPRTGMGKLIRMIVNWWKEKL